MTAYLLTLHLAALALPAAALAAFMVPLAGWMPGWRKRRPLLEGWLGRWLLTFALNLSAAVAGLLVFGVDGKMATYGVLVGVSAVTQFVLWRGWRA